MKNPLRKMSGLELHESVWADALKEEATLQITATGIAATTTRVGEVALHRLPIAYDASNQARECQRHWQCLPRGISTQQMDCSINLLYPCAFGAFQQDYERRSSMSNTCTNPSGIRSVRGGHAVLSVCCTNMLLICCCR